MLVKFEKIHKKGVSNFYIVLVYSFSALTLLGGRQEGYLACKKILPQQSQNIPSITWSNLQKNKPVKQKLKMQQENV